MKKLMIIALVLVFAAGAAYAEDRLSLNGSFRVQGWSTEADDWDSDTETDYWSQRLRIGGKIAVAEDVAVNFRMDLGEGTWGEDYGPGGGTVVRPRGDYGDSRSTIDLDRGYVVITKPFWELSAGQQFLGLGVSEFVDANMPSIVFRIKPMEPLGVSLIYGKVTENGSLTDEDVTDDVDIYAANVGWSGDLFSVKAYGAMVTDGSPDEFEPYGAGVYGSATFGAINFEGELDFFGGSSKASGTEVDFMGTQLYLAGDAGISDMIRAGAEFFYAMGDDEDVQLTGLSDWWTFTPMGMNTPQSGNISAFSPNGTTSPFDPSGDGAGALGGTLWADFAFFEGFKLGAKVGYWTVSEDDATDMDNLFAWNAYVSYMIATNSNLSLTYLNSTPDFDSAVSDDTYKVGVLELMIKF